MPNILEYETLTAELAAAVKKRAIKKSYHKNFKNSGENSWVVKKIVQVWTMQSEVRVSPVFLFLIFELGSKENNLNNPNQKWEYRRSSFSYFRISPIPLEKHQSSKPSQIKSIHEHRIRHFRSSVPGPGVHGNFDSVMPRELRNRTDSSLFLVCKMISWFIWGARGVHKNWEKAGEAAALRPRTRYACRTFFLLKIRGHCVCARRMIRRSERKKETEIVDNPNYYIDCPSNAKI